MELTQPTLLILAAGRGSRFGGAKQVTPMGPSGEAIMEYSIYDALNSGFGKVVLVINKSVESDTFELVDRMKGVKDKIAFAYQDLCINMIPNEVQEARLKPWGTAHAILAASEEIDGNFAMINADDFYGREAYETMADFLSSHQEPHQFSMVGYDMINTLSKNGTVSRGVSKSDTKGYLSSIEETHGIFEENGHIWCDGPDGQKKQIDTGLASMNFWGFQQNLFAELKTQFENFLDTTKDLTKEEFLIPSVVDKMIKDGKIRVSVLHSAAKWFGVTYKEDTDSARQSLMNKVESGDYPNPLWS